MKSVLAFIPARGGSKGLPRKNVLPLCGKPLVAWSLEQAQASRLVTDIFLSTDSQEIADIGAQFGCKPPHLRPAELAQDKSPTFDAIKHTLDWYRSQGKNFDIVAQLEPTSPLRREGDIDGAIQLLLNNWDKADAVVSVGEIHMESPYVAKRIDTGFVTAVIAQETTYFQRQQLPRAYFPYGVIYLSKTEHYLETKTFYPPRTLPFEIERWQNYEVDDVFDFDCIEAILRKRIRNE